MLLSVLEFTLVLVPVVVHVHSLAVYFALEEVSFIGLTDLLVLVKVLHNTIPVPQIPRPLTVVLLLGPDGLDSVPLTLTVHPLSDVYFTGRLRQTPLTMDLLVLPLTLIDVTVRELARPLPINLVPDPGSNILRTIRVVVLALPMFLPLLPLTLVPPTVVKVHTAEPVRHKILHVSTILH